MKLFRVGLFYDYCPDRHNTRFSRLSDEAQDLIVRAVIGEFDQSGPPAIPDDVRNEISKWVNEES